MKQLLSPASTATVLVLLGSLATAQVQVLTTIPDLADIAREIGGPHVEVTSIAKGTENIHRVAILPSHLVKANRADLLVQVGLSLEHAYVPGLLQNARNKAIRPGQPGFVNCSDGWEAIDVPAELSRGQGVDIHPLGNPHMNLDPRGGAHMARRILAGLLRVDPAHKREYEERHGAYAKKLAAARERWGRLGAKLEGCPIVVYHSDFTYFARFYKMDVVKSIEPKPGMPPSPRHLAEVVDVIREQDVKLILTARWSNNRDVRYVASKSGARVVEIPTMVHGVKGVDSWIGMMDFLHTTLADALNEAD